MLIIGEMLIKTTMRYHLTPVRKAIIKKPTNDSGEDVKKRDPSCTVGGNVNLYSHYGEQYLFSCSVMSDSLPPHGLKHTRLPCPSPAPGAYSNSCPLSPWCHPTVSSSVIRFSSCLQSFSIRVFFNESFFVSGGQNIGVSGSASVLPMNIQGWFPLGLTDLISLQSKRLSRVFSKTTVQKHQFFGAQLSLWTNSHIHTWLLEKPYLWQ